jgi:vancomycin resistance protein VanJ
MSTLVDSTMRTKRFLLGLGWGYVLFVGVWFILRLVFFDRLWWIALINYVGIYWFIPLPILIAFGLRLRYWRLLLGLAIPTLTFLGLYGAFFLPSFQQDQGTLTVMSFNVWDSSSDEQAIAHSIRTANPNVVGLQEIDSETTAALIQELSAEYAYQALMSPNPAQPNGVAILSRFPIEETVTFTLPGDRSGIRAAIWVDETRI